MGIYYQIIDVTDFGPYKARCRVLSSYRSI